MITRFALEYTMASKFGLVHAHSPLYLTLRISKGET